MQIILKDARLSFFDVFEPKAFENNPDKRYGANLLIVPGSDNHKAIEGAITKVAGEKYGTKATAIMQTLRGNTNKFCYHDGDTKTYAGYEGMMYLSSHRKEEDGPPQVKARNGDLLTKTSGKLYRGCYVNAIVDIYAQTGKYPGIRCTLLGLQFSRDGESFGGAVRLGDDAFDGLIVPDDAADDLM